MKARINRRPHGWWTRSIAHAWCSLRQEFDQPRAPHDRRAGDELAGIKTAFLETWRTHEDGPTSFDEAGDQVFEGLKTLFVDRVGCALHGQPNALGAEEDHGLLVRGDGGTGDDESDGGPVGIIKRMGQ